MSIAPNPTLSVNYFSDHLKELVRKIAYKFYTEHCTYILSEMVEITYPITLEDLSAKLKMKLKDLSTSIGSLEADGMVSHIEKIDETMEVPGEKMTDARKKKCTKSYYYLDYKSIIDSIRAKYEICCSFLRGKCGPEDSIFYKCPKCNAKYHQDTFIMGNMNDDDYFLCPNCHCSVERIDNDAEIDQKHHQLTLFIQEVKPLIELLNGFDEFVIINQAEFRCDPTKMMRKEDYNREHQKRENEKDDPWSSKRSGSAIRDGANQQNQEIVLEGEKPKKNIGSDVILKMDPKPESSEDPTIELGGKMFKLSELTNEVLEALPDEFYDIAVRFVEDNKEFRVR